MRLRVKICGITDAAGIAAAVAADVDAVGFVFADSPRRVAAPTARRLAGLLPAHVRTVAVFHRPRREEVDAVLAAFAADIVQVEPAAELAGIGPLLPVFHDGPGLVREVEAHRALRPRAAVLIEGAGPGGRGTAANREVAAALASAGPVVFAGGLTPENVADAVARVRPWAVDVSSGVESAPGRKDPVRVRAFVEAARRAALAARVPRCCP